MPRIIDRVDYHPAGDGDRDRQSLAKLLETIIEYAPDRTYSLGQPTSAGVPPRLKLLQDLDCDFMRAIYYDRPIRVEVQSKLERRRVIVFSGLSGAGKTVIAKAICSHYLPQGGTHLYVDLKAKDDLFRNVDSSKSRTTQQVEVNHALDSILKSDALKMIDAQGVRLAFAAFAIANDEVCAPIRLRYAQLENPLATPWIELLSAPEHAVAYEYRQIVEKIQLTTYLRFIDRHMAGRTEEAGPLLVVFDNVDRFDLKTQEIIVEYLLGLSNSAEVSALLCIRDSNIGRFTKEGKGGDLTADITIDYHDAFRFELDEQLDLDNAELDDSPPAHQISADEIANLIHKRLGYLQTRPYLSRVITAPMVMQYMHTLNQITPILASKCGLANACNDGIREVLVRLNRIVEKVLLRSDTEYSYEHFVVEKAHLERKSRSLFYKTLACGREDVPYPDLQYINIVSEIDSSVPFLCLRILEFMAATNGFHSRNRVPTSAIVAHFDTLGIRQDQVLNALGRLESEFGGSELGLIWCDMHEESRAERDPGYYVLPAGRFFVTRYAFSLEYLYWAIIAADLPESPLPLERPDSHARIPARRLQPDSVKLGTVVRFMSGILWPRVEQELEFAFNRRWVAGQTYEQSVRQYRSHHFPHGKHFFQRMLDSVHAFSTELDIEASRLRELQEELSRLRSAFEAKVNELSAAAH